MPSVNPFYLFKAHILKHKYDILYNHFKNIINPTYQIDLTHVKFEAVLTSIFKVLSFQKVKRSSKRYDPLSFNHGFGVT